MKISGRKTKRILMSILLCGAISSSVYAEGERITVESGETYEGVITGTYSGLGGSNYNNGGAIENSGTINSVGDETGVDATVFDTNSANRYGGAIYNTGGIGSIANVTFTENSTISTSSSYGGGAIYNSSSGTIGSITGTLSGEVGEVTSTSTFTGNTGRDGGAIFNAGTIENIENTIFTENETVSSNYGGGAIYNTGGIGSIENCIFSGNEASSVYGGAIYNNNSGTISEITGSTFEGNSANSGGAIANRSTAENPIGSITDCIFTGNTASSNGGAIYSNPSGSSVTIGSITGSTFTGNTSGSHGGAIYLSSTTNLESLVNTTFSENSAGNTSSGDGGAIYSGGATIGSIEGVIFDTNTASGNGGAIRNYGTITIIKSYEDDKGATVNTTFTGNTASGSNGGGAIYNYSGGIIGTIDEGTAFTNNTAANSGGAIYNGQNSVITSITGNTFTGNTATSGNGGAIYNYDEATIGSIKNTTFTGNKAESGDGGAIFNYDDATIGSIDNTTFTSNTAAHDGGAIYNFWETETGNGKGIIDDITGSTFEKNIANNYGGAIFNRGYIGLDEDGETVMGGISKTTFTENESERGGAIYNGIQRDVGSDGSFDSIITSIDNCYFGKNIAYAFGGAIYNYDDAYIWNISNNTFEENTAQNGNGGAIENAEAGSVIGTITNNQFLKNDVSESAHGGGAIYSEGSITSITENNFEENKSGNFGGAIYNNGGTIGDEDTGESISNNTFTGNTSERGGAIYNTGNRSVDDTGAETINPDAPGVITSIDGNTFSGNIANDFGGAIYNYKYGEIKSITGNTFEKNAANGGNGGAIENAEPESVIGKISGNTFTKNTAAAGGAAIYNEGSIESITGNTFTENQAGTYGGAIYNNGGTITELSGDTFTGNSAVSEEGDAAGGAIYNSGTISTFSVQTLSGNYAEGTTSAMGGAIYDEGKSEITIDGDVTGNYATASSGEAKGGAIYAGEGTEVTLSGNITGNSATGTTAQGGAIYNAGTVNINIENKDAVISGNKTVSGGTEEANVLYGEAASVTNFNLTDASLTLEDSLTGDTGYEVNVKGNGTDSTTFYMLNDILDSNLSFSGTTINTINNEVKAYSVNKLSISGNVNFVADVDLANETMDRFTASEYGSHAGNLNVSGMNLISDTENDSVEIPFAEAGLKDNVTSSVGTLPDSTSQQKAYTPLYQYNVAYDNRSDGGYFTFDKAGNNPSADVPEEGEAAAISFMNLMYRYAFEHSDYYMKLPKKVRLAIMKGEEGDVEKEFKNYNGHNLTDPGIWVKPFASNETVPFSHQFTARTKNYGLLVGIDTAFKEKGKWANVFTGYAGYDGIKQTFDGNSTEQYGGVIGVTDTLYKGNFYAALTLSGGENVLKAKTMYGREKTHLYMAGAAVKTGYNLEFAGGNYSFLPTFMASYTYADIKDYTSASGLKMDSDGMHAVELNPNFKFIRNLNNGWMPYVTVGEIWTVGQHSKVKASGTELDELTFRPYTEYGLGVQKMWSKGYDGYAEFLGHAGGRRGWLVNLGFRWTF